MKDIVLRHSDAPTVRDLIIEEEQKDKHVIHGKYTMGDIIGNKHDRALQIGSNGILIPPRIFRR